MLVTVLEQVETRGGTTSARRMKCWMQHYIRVKVQLRVTYTAHLSQF